MSAEKKIMIIAGPNGAGKTTFAQECLPFEAGCPLFINADLIAAGLSPFDPDAAAFAQELDDRGDRSHAAAGRELRVRDGRCRGIAYARRIRGGERRVQA